MVEKRSDEPRIVKGSDDIFADLGVQLDPKDRLKVLIAIQLSKAIQHLGLTQKEAADILGTDQAKISKITRGRLKDFTVDRLVNYVIALGIDVDVRLSNTHDRRGNLTVHSPIAATG
ncbi:helix-turn-helix domain-containing protein [Rhizobium laguerreae]|uniref:XRE family transcriptional regulator n=1 Tax=Rhizobium laguerreae TaxID=1076926 RepID=A0A7Y2W324_9HYPH|nr:helix-turn-helix transcriptional regulator [Rhizobium laguerreae]NNH61685.1 XRE family transcriptional regulator [Rhizobium laguerreae]